jgi:hypothetical protein
LIIYKKKIQKLKRKTVFKKLRTSLYRVSPKKKTSP